MKVNTTLSLYFEVKNAVMFGGIGSIGYTSTNFDFETENMPKVNVEKVAKLIIDDLTRLFKIPEENIRIISRTEYEENTEE